MSVISGQASGSANTASHHVSRSKRSVSLRFLGVFLLLFFVWVVFVFGVGFVSTPGFLLFTCSLTT